MKMMAGTARRWAWRWKRERTREAVRGGRARSTPRRCIPRCRRSGSSRTSTERIRRDNRGALPPRRQRAACGRAAARHAEASPRHGPRCASRYSPRATRRARPRRPAPTSWAGPTSPPDRRRFHRLRRGHRHAGPDGQRRQARPHSRPLGPDAEPQDRNGHVRRRQGRRGRESGKPEYRTDRGANIHIAIGKSSSTSARWSRTTPRSKRSSVPSRPVEGAVYQGHHADDHHGPRLAYRSGAGARHRGGVPAGGPSLPEDCRSRSTVQRRQEPPQTTGSRLDREAAEARSRCVRPT